MTDKQKWVFIVSGLLFILAISYLITLKDGFSLFIIFGAGLLLLVAIFQKPYLGIVFMLCMLPLEIYAVLPANLKAFTSFTSLFGLAALVFYIARNKKFLSESRTADKNIYILAILLFSVILIGEFFKPISTGFSYPFTYIQLFLLVWLCEQLFTSHQQIETLMKLFIASNIIAVAISLPNFRLFSLWGEVNRLSGLEGNANEFAVYLSVAIIMIVYFSMAAAKKRTGILLMLLAIILVFPIIFSGSRGAILFLAPVIALQLWQFRNNKILLALFILMAFILTSGILGPYLPTEYTQRIISIPQDIVYANDTIGLRYGLWQYGLKLWSQEPIFGIGSGMFRISSISSPVLQGTRMLPLHNTYLTHLVENGIIGLFFYLLIIARSAINYSGVIRSVSRNSPLRGLAITWQSVMLFILLNGIKGDWNANKLLWISFALSMVVVSLQRNTMKVEIASEIPNPLITEPRQI